MQVSIPEAVVTIHAMNDNEAKEYLEILAESWSYEFILDAVDDGLFEADLQYISTRAFELENGVLYKILSQSEVLPFNLEYGSTDEKWYDFMHQLLKKSPLIAGISLRFFRADDKEFIWRNNLDYLISIAGAAEICDKTYIIGSIVRIVTSLSDPGFRHRALWLVVTNALSGSYLFHANKRAQHYHTVIHSCPELFMDSKIWTEHAVRNIIIEAINDGLEGQINHKNPTKTLCRFANINLDHFWEQLSA